MKTYQISCLLFSFFLVLFSFKSNSQTIQYSPLRCAGEIPDDFLLLNYEKINSEFSQIEGSNTSKNEKNIEKEFANKSTFRIDDILFSGKTLYGDVLTNYVNQIADIVLETDPTLRKKLRFYVLKSSDVNAFSTYQGIIFVTVGLLSQMENEAQLAFILSHEIAHYKLNHTLNSYKLNEQIKNAKGKFAELSLEDRIKQTFGYSKENELEADKEGYKIYSKTKYSKQAVIGSFDMLLYSYLAYDEIDWHPSTLQDTFYQFPIKYKKNNESIIKADEEEDDEESTHPNIRKRKENIEVIINKSFTDIKWNEDTTIHLTSENNFYFIQKQARTELFNILINKADYYKLFYYSYLYSKIYSEDSIFCNHLSSFSIYGLTIKKLPENDDDKQTNSNNAFKSDEESDVEKFEGTFNNVYTFLKKLGYIELSILSTRLAWKNYTINPSDEIAKKLLHNSLYVLFRHSNLSADFFVKNQINDSTFKIHSNIVSKEKLTKSQKLKLKQEQQKEEIQISEYESSKNSKLKYTTGAFKLIFEDKYFEHLYDSLSFIGIEDRNSTNENESYNKYAKPQKKIMKYGHNAGIDSIIMLNPNYSTYKIRSEQVFVNKLMDERNEINLAQVYAEMAKENNINLTEINILDRKNLTTEKLNEYSIITDWLSERVNNSNNTYSIIYNKHQISSVIQNRKCKNLMISGLSFVSEEREVNPEVVLTSILIIPLLPAVIFHYFTHNKEVYMNTIIIDLENGELKYLNRKNLKFKPNKNILRAHVFALFHDLKSKKNNLNK
ncbi:MAG: M48 family metallopeptidase [Bacteroidota bacterium]|nr:M48 family metallopeptidase [Bacteroidota bacterium]